MRLALREIVLTEWAGNEHLKRWIAYEGGAHTKSFFPRPVTKCLTEIGKPLVLLQTGDEIGIYIICEVQSFLD